MPINFYVIVGGSLALAFLVVYLCKRQERREHQEKK